MSDLVIGTRQHFRTQTFVRPGMVPSAWCEADLLAHLLPSCWAAEPSAGDGCLLWFTWCPEHCWPTAIFKYQTFSFLMLTGTGKGVITFPKWYWVLRDWNRPGFRHFLNGKFKVFSISVRVQNHLRTQCPVCLLGKDHLPWGHSACLPRQHCRGFLNLHLSSSPS